MNRLTPITISRFPNLFWSPQNTHKISKIYLSVYDYVIKLRTSLSPQNLYLILFENIRHNRKLELLVAQRTRDLLDSQIQRNLELERFAEFGRICANLLHEVASPLTAASLNLDLFDGSESKALLRARKNLHQLERYLNATRQQLKSQSKLENFSVRCEFKRLLLVMEPIATSKGISIVFDADDNYQLFGDPVKFTQVLANLISNSVDAYEGVTAEPSQKTIYVKVSASSKFLKLKVIDWGKGIEPEAMPWLFKPFYSTKSNTERGTGIGLTMVKRVVEEDFHGNINVVSNPRLGTRFIICLKR